MALVNNTMIIRRDILTKIARLKKNGRLEEDIDRIPLEISPKDKGSTRRCCIYKERAITRYKIFPYLGFHPDYEKCELDSLSLYVEEAKDRDVKDKTEDILSIVDQACTSCVKISYIVTNLCKGCVASPCYMNCPKQAISFNKITGQAEINQDKCVNCGICQKACPYHSIIYVPVPCEEACPVGAISKNSEGLERIDDDKCIYCGKCVNACPFGSIFEISDVMDVFNAIERGEKVVAMPAPSIMGQYKSDTGRIITAIKKLGFHDVVEVAEGAMVTTDNEAEELNEKLEEGQKFMTTSCCPSYVQAVKKHAKELQPYVSHTGSPMYYTAKIARERYPDAKTLFIGPCIAKRKEAKENPDVDFVMTFEELDSFFKGFDIDVAACEPTELKSITRESRNYGQSGGVAGAVLAKGVAANVAPIKINGIDKKGLRLMKSYVKKAPGNFFEVMACEGGCIGGPVASMEGAKGRRQMVSNIDAIYKDID